ncbi:MAG: purine-binding chemotaxis protein CheW [Gammaproteobacteria bacterium]|nr:purine-binding chemotaxis protein CheW [Gammaproteobacteria bacterium]
MTSDAASVQDDEAFLEEDASNQYVAFQIDRDVFAIPMINVLEIIRIPDTVSVPMTPPSLIGLANLRGSVLPVLDLRALLGLNAGTFDDATRVMVVDMGRPVGLVVDRVNRVFDVDPNSLESAEHVQSTIDASLVQGVVKNLDGAALVQLIDLDRAVGNGFESMLGTERTDAAQGLGAVDIEERSLAKRDVDEDEDGLQLVIFELDGQEYGFDIRDVEEIVRVPDEISAVPNSGHHVLGLVNLRAQLLPLVSLRRMFSLPEQALNDHNRILVLSLGRAAGRGDAVGIVVDQVREVLRVAQDVQDKVPAMLRQSGDMQEIGAVCRLNGGKRLVSLLTAGALFQNTMVQQALEIRDERAESSSEELMDTVERLDEEDETQLVVFTLADQEFGVPIAVVQEITRVPDELTRVPKTPDFIEGLVNLRGSVLPVVDMRCRFGMARMSHSERQRILVLELGAVRTGFVTDSVLEVLRLSKTLIEQSPKLSDEQARVVGRVVNFKEKKRIIQVLDAHELLDRQELEALSETA